MIGNIIKQVFGSRNSRVLKEYASTVKEINALEEIKNNLGKDFDHACECIANCGQRCIVIGIGISTVFIFIQNQYGIIPLPADVYFINQLPMVITTIDLMVVLIIANFFVLFSGLIASKRATILNIRESLQWEK